MTISDVLELVNPGRLNLEGWSDLRARMTP